MIGLSDGFSALTNAYILSAVQANGWIEPIELSHIWRHILRGKAS